MRNLRWWVHEVEGEQVFDAETLEEKHHVGQVRPLDLGHLRLEHLFLELAQRVQPVAHPSQQEVDMTEYCTVYTRQESRSKDLMYSITELVYGCL